MTGQIATNNTVTFDGYIHCAAVMIKGMLEDKATQLIYLAKGKKGVATFEECFNVCNWVYFSWVFHYLSYIHMTFFYQSFRLK